MPETSEPAFGSVSANDVRSASSTSGGNHSRFCSSFPATSCASSRRAFCSSVSAKETPPATFCSTVATLESYLIDWSVNHPHGLAGHALDRLRTRQGRSANDDTGERRDPRDSAHSRGDRLREEQRACSDRQGIRP